MWSTEFRFLVGIQNLFKINVFGLNKINSLKANYFICNFFFFNLTFNINLKIYFLNLGNGIKNSFTIAREFVRNRLNTVVKSQNLISNLICKYKGLDRYYTMKRKDLYLTHLGRLFKLFFLFFFIYKGCCSVFNNKFDILNCNLILVKKNKIL